MPVPELVEGGGFFIVLAKGSTSSRTRLYQIAISTKWPEIESFLKVYGFVNGEWKGFSKDENYEAFLATRI